MEAMGWKVALVAKSVEAMEEDHRVLDTVLALVITFMPLTALPLAIAIPAPWQLATTNNQGPPWAWIEMQWYLHWPEAPSLAPTLGPLPAKPPA